MKVSKTFFGVIVEKGQGQSSAAHVLRPILVFVYNHGSADTSKAKESGADGQKFGSLPHNLRFLSHQIFKVLKNLYTYHLHWWIISMLALISPFAVFLDLLHKEQNQAFSDPSPLFPTVFSSFFQQIHLSAVYSVGSSYK